MTADPAALRALAARVETEEPTPELNLEVGEAFGWRRGPAATPVSTWAISPTGDWRNGFPDFLTDLTAAASAMPVEWEVVVIQRALTWDAIADSRGREPGTTPQSVEATAPTEPRARVAAALRARAAGMEATDA